MSITVERKIKLSKEGFPPIIARFLSNGTWQGLGYTYRNGDERWFDYSAGFVENYLANLPDDVTLEELLK